MSSNQYKGFTLVEVMVSVLIFTIIMLSASSFFTSTQKNLRKSEKNEIAVRLANSKMEQIKSSLYDLIENNSENINIDGYRFNRYTTVISDDGYKVINVRVDNQIAIGAVTLAEFDTIISEK
jgi:prepilin-type N-terminal cleavage/methylation domain-containing protein